MAAVAFMKVVGALAAKPLGPNKDSAMVHVNEFLSASRRAAAGERQQAPRQAARRAVLVVVLRASAAIVRRSSPRRTASLSLALAHAPATCQDNGTKQPQASTEQRPYLHTLG